MTEFGRYVMLTASLAVLCSGFVSAANATDTVVVQWTKIMLQIIRDTRPLPPVSARYLAILDTCMYDAWTAYDQLAVSTQANGIPRQSNTLPLAVQKAVSFAAYRATPHLRG